MSSLPVKKAVFPVAGFGSRFLPATKAQPKEMLPVVDKPLIQYAVEEAIEAGIKDLIFITGRNKRAIEDHFDKAYELETELEAAGKTKLLAHIQHILPDDVNCIFIRQISPLGLGHAVLCAKPVVGNEPFAVLLADDFMRVPKGSRNVLAQMLDVYKEKGKTLLAVQEVSRESVSSYGIIDGEPIGGSIERVKGIVEKPTPDKAPSTLGVVGRYILDPEIFEWLEKKEKGAGGEIQLTDAIQKVTGTKGVLAYHFDGVRYDCGSKLGFMQASIATGLEHPEIAAGLADYLKKLSVPGA